MPFCYCPPSSHPVILLPLPLPLFNRTIYGQMGTMFIQQGSLMDNRIPLPSVFGGDGAALYIPSATMALFNTGAIILLVPLYDSVLEPAIKAVGFKWTLLRRIGEGTGWPVHVLHGVGH